MAPATGQPWACGRSPPWRALLAVLCAQAAFSWQVPRHWRAEPSPGPAPPASVARLAALGETRLAGYAMVLYVQGFDMQAGQPLPIRTLSSAAIRGWLERALDLNPGSGYPLLLASRIYAEASHPDDARAMLRMVKQRFEAAPALRWQWMAHGIYVARHALGDLPLAAELARSLREHADGPAVPSWARQAEIFLLADMDRLQAARALLGGLIQSGRIADQAELDFLTGKLEEFDRRALHADPPAASGER